jgi:hypothetical protein
MSNPENETREISIWFFCGILTLVYGLVLLVTGIVEFNHPPANELLLPANMQNLHPTFWWGALMTVFGSIYTIKFRPGKA